MTKSPEREVPPRPDALEVVAPRNIILPAQEVLRRLENLEALFTSQGGQQVAKGWYTTTEAAKILGRAPWTVREWCRLGRVHARKRPCGRGQSAEWVISHEELERIRNEGLLPLKD